SGPRGVGVRGWPVTAAEGWADCASERQQAPSSAMRPTATTARGARRGFMGRNPHCKSNDFQPDAGPCERTSFPPCTGPWMPAPGSVLQVQRENDLERGIGALDDFQHAQQWAVLGVTPPV